MTTATLPEAERIAAAIVADLAPACAHPVRWLGALAHRGGRRHRACGHPTLRAGLFGDCTANHVWAYLHASDAYGFTRGDHPNGRYYQLTLPLHAGVQLDLFLAQPDNWGLTLLVRTGSAAFSTALLARCKRRQGLGRAQPGSVDGRLQMEQELEPVRPELHE